MKFTTRSVFTIAVCFAALTSLQINNLDAATIFVLDNTSTALSDGLSNGDTLSEDGINLTFSNVVVSDGSSVGDVEGVGILISSTVEPGLTDVISFDFSFSQNVQIDTYDIGTRESVPSNSFFTITGPNGTSGNNTIPAGTLFSETTHNFDAGTIPFFLAGQVYSFTHNLPTTDDPLFNLEELVINVVPEPSTCYLLATGCLLSIRIGKRRSHRLRYS